MQICTTNTSPERAWKTPARPLLRRAASLLALAANLLVALPASANAISYLETHTQGVAGVNGLSGISDVAVSADGKFVYTASYASGAVSVFERNPATGQLTYRSSTNGITNAFSVDVSADNKSVYVASPGGQVYAYSRNVTTGALTAVNTATGAPTAGFVSVSASPDAATVYGVGGNPSGLVVFSRDTATGSIARVADYADNTNGHALGQQFGPTTSPIKNIATSADGRFVYVTSTSDNAVSLFSRDATTGTLTQLAVYQDGVAGVDGLQGASSTKISPDGRHLYVSGQGESSVAVFGIDATTGFLAYAGKVTQGSGGISSLQGARSLAISPDGRYVYASAINANAVTAFDRDATTGLLSFNMAATNAVGGVTGLTNPSGMATDPLNRHLYVAGQGSHSLVAFTLPTPSVQLSATQATAAFNGGASVLDAQLQVFDADSPQLASATVSIGSGFVNTDALSVQTVAGIAASYNAATGVLSLTGTAPLADYQAVLRTLSFRSGADPSVPAGGYSSRSIVIAVSDGANTSALAAISVTVGPAATAAAAPVAIPTLSEWGLMLLSSLFAAFAFMHLRRKR